MPLPPGSMNKAVKLGGAALVAQLAMAVLWPVPRQDEFDASGRSGTHDGTPLRLAALGDSTLTGPGVDGPEQIWIRLVADRLADRLERPVELRSLGTGGSTTAQVARRQLPAALEFAPHLAMVSTGANDVIRGVPAIRFARHLEDIIGGLCDAGSIVVTSGVGDLGSIPRLTPPLRQMATRLGRSADRVHDRVARRHGVVKADQWRWAAAEFRQRQDVWSRDRFHPNAAGHRIWADVAWQALDPLLDELRGC